MIGKVLLVQLVHMHSSLIEKASIVLYSNSTTFSFLLLSCIEVGNVDCNVDFACFHAVGN